MMLFAVTLWSLLATGCYSYVDDSRIPPDITTVPEREIVFQEGETIELPCSATGLPEPSIEWYFNRRLLEYKHHHRPDPKSGRIIIERAIAHSHGGIYQCTAANKFGTAKSPTIQLRQAILNYDSVQEPKTMMVNQGEPFSLIPSTGLDSFPPPVYTWKTVEEDSNEDFKRIETSNRIALDRSTGILFFANALPKDQAEEGRVYKLDARNIIQDKTIGGSPYDLIIEPRNVTQHPLQLLIPKSDKSITGLKGQAVTLKCFFGGLPTPTVEWNLPDGDGPPPHRIDCTKEFGTECLIQNLQFSDEGVYECTGRSNGKSMVVRMKLVVEAVPTFEAAPESRNVTEGQNVMFRCKPGGKPTPQIQWFSNGHPIDVKNTGSNRIIISEDKTELTATKVCKDCDGSPATDLQVFQCKISNKHGDAYASGYLNVLLRTILPKYRVSNTYILNVTEEAVQPEVFNFSCDPKTDSLIKNNLKIMWRKGRKPIPKGHPYKLENHGRNLVINITEGSKFVPYLGRYNCIIKSPFIKLTITFNLSATAIPQLSTGQFLLKMWWLIALTGVLLIVVAVLVTGLRGISGNEGGVYKVYEFEINDGNDPDHEIQQDEFIDYTPLSATVKLAVSRSSLGSFEEL